MQDFTMTPNLPTKPVPTAEEDLVVKTLLAMLRFASFSDILPDRLAAYKEDMEKVVRNTVAATLKGYSETTMNNIVRMFLEYHEKPRHIVGTVKPIEVIREAEKETPAASAAVTEPLTYHEGPGFVMVEKPQTPPNLRPVDVDFITKEVQRHYLALVRTDPDTLKKDVLSRIHTVYTFINKEDAGWIACRVVDFYFPSKPQPVEQSEDEEPSGERFDSEVQCGDKVAAMTTTPDGSVYFTGVSGTSIFIAKEDKKRSPVWRIQPNTKDKEKVHHIASLNNNDVVIVGHRTEGKLKRPFLRRITSDGVAWCHNFFGEQDRLEGIAYGVAVDAYGSCYITGTAFDTTTHTKRLFVYKIDSVRNVLWRFISATNDESAGSSVAVDQQGNVYVTGESRNNKTTITVVAKFDKFGTPVWERELQHQGNTCGIDLVLAGNDVVVTGNAHNGNTYDGFIARIDYLGVVLWQRRIASSEEHLMVIKVDYSQRDRMIHLFANKGIDNKCRAVYLCFNQEGCVLDQKALSSNEHSVEIYAAAVPTDGKSRIAVATNNESRSDFCTHVRDFDHVRAGIRPILSSILPLKVEGVAFYISPGDLIV